MTSKLSVHLSHFTVPDAVHITREKPENILEFSYEEILITVCVVHGDRWI